MLPLSNVVSPVNKKSKCQRAVEYADEKCRIVKKKIFKKYYFQKKKKKERKKLRRIGGFCTSLFHFSCSSFAVTTERISKLSTFIGFYVLLLSQISAIFSSLCFFLVFYFSSFVRLETLIDLIVWNYTIRRVVRDVQAQSRTCTHIVIGNLRWQ